MTLEDAKMLTGKVALVTGGSSGVGRELALALSRAGARVAVGARRLDKLSSVVAEIAAEGGEAFAVPLDVEDELSIKAAYDAIEAHWGLVDVIIVNAGVSAGGGRSTEIDSADMDWAMRVNFRGSYLTAREGARRIIAGPAGEDRGRIIFIGSIAASTALLYGAAYCASKAAVVAMSRCFAKEWARMGITVNTVCPGFMMTDLSADYINSKGFQENLGRYPRRRLMEIEDLCGSVLYLASPSARSTTGAILMVDDGQTL